MVGMQLAPVMYVTSVSPLSRCKVMTFLSVMLHLQHVYSGRRCHNSIIILNILTVLCIQTSGLLQPSFAWSFS